MASFRPTKIPVVQQLGEKVTEDTRYWKSFKTTVQVKEFGAITKIDFSPLPPHNYAVTASTRVQIYGPHSQEPQRSFTRFKSTAYGGCFRGDGQLLVTGSEEGLIRLFDVSGRVALRQYSGHNKAVRVTSFLSDGFRVASGSDDLTCRVWDVATAQELLSFSEHTDYIRALATSTRNPDLIITGAYDHTVRVYDARQEKCVMSMDHGQPVESVLLYPSDGLLVSTGGRYVKVWDMLKGGQELVSLKNHHKTVTCVCMSAQSNRLLTGSLDRHVKVYNSSYKVVHSFEYAASILSMAISPDDGVLAVGMTNGVLSVRHRKSSEEKQEADKKRRGPAYRVFVKGRNYVPKQDDFLVKKSAALQYLSKHDKHLKGFAVTKALDSAMELSLRKNKPEVCVGVLLELERRGTLQNALSGRDEKSLVSLQKFLLKFITNPQFSPILHKVADMVIDIYQSVVCESAVVERLFQELLDCVSREVDYQRDLMQVLGMLDTLFASSTPRSRATTSISPVSLMATPQGTEPQMQPA
ncbi:U3 small nucleolar RNA-associated protein 15 homolog [Sardina pilchardus]|uniref:U3 small nucleolar RNA-associated protein 15 homolog n=1 Tax=Sardina pilchardus TaxID=27697 RepID=UPI002E0D6C4F